jgi:phosphatidylserine decarboxylase
MEYNFFNLKVISNDIINDRYLFEIYCNNTNYYGLYNDTDNHIIINQIIVPLYSKYIVLYITNLYNDKFYTYNMLNKIGNYKISIGYDEFYISIQNNNDLLLDSITINNSNFIDETNKYYYHCELKTIIPEINDDNWTYINSILTNNSHVNFKNLRKFMTNMVGTFLKSSISKYIISNFVRKFNINVKSFQISKYNSFNDFFIRRLLIDPIIIEYNTIIRCPVNGKIMVFNDLNANNSFTVWIKGNNFTVDKLIDNTTNKKIITMIVCRLSIYDYHHFHMPFTGVLKNITVLGDEYFSVKPEIVNSPINVLNENYRHIYEFSAIYNSTEFTYWLISVGALVVGSIEHNMVIGNKYLSGERIGNFSLGGSTVIILSSIRININDDINYFSSNGIESYVKVGDTIGNLAISNEVIKYPKKYYVNNFKNQFNIEKNTMYILKVLFGIFLFYLIAKIIKNNK